MKEPSQALSTVTKGYFDSLKENPVPTLISGLAFFGLTGCLAYAYKNNYLTLWGAKSEPQGKQSVGKIKGKNVAYQQVGTAGTDQHIEEINAEGNVGGGQLQIPVQGGSQISSGTGFRPGQLGNR